MTVLSRLLIYVLACSFMVVAYAQEADLTDTVDETGEESSADTPAKKPTRLSSAMPRSRSPRDEHHSMQLLASYLPKGGLVWVEHSPEPFLGYWQQDRSGVPQGALLILHSEGASPVWQNTTRPLHESLPDYGWATFALVLPEPDTPEIPSRTLAVKTVPIAPVQDDADSVDDQEVEEPLDLTDQADELISEPAVVEVPKEVQSLDQIVEARLESALRFLHDQGQYNIVIAGSGFNAMHAQRFINKITPQILDPELREQLEKPIRALILVNGRGFPVGQSSNLAEQDSHPVQWLNDPELPVLDIYFKQDLRNKQAAKQRRYLAKQRGMASYTQVPINELSGERSWYENQLSRRIRSFMAKNAKGVEVDGVLTD